MPSLPLHPQIPDAQPALADVEVIGEQPVIAPKVDQRHDARTAVQCIKGQHFAGTAFGLPMRINLNGNERSCPAAMR